MKIRFSKPHPLLNAYIERYWSWESEEEGMVYMPHVTPGLGMDLYFHYRQPFQVDGRGMLPASHAIYSDTHSSRILPAKEIGFIAVRFRCARFGHFIKMPAHELSDQCVDAGDFWKQKGDELVEQLTESPGFEERVGRLNLFFLRQLDTQEKDTSLWSHVMDQLFYDHEEVRIYALAKKMKITPRHFRRVFRDVSGITPKHFQQLSRFHAVLKELLIHRDTNYLPVALDKGYFDQTHFIKEFKRFMGITPSVFLTDANFMSHFYYPSF